MAGFSPVGSLPVAATPEATGAVNYNLVTPNVALLSFVGFLPAISNKPGAQVEQFGLYIGAASSSPEAIVEQHGAYILGKVGTIAQVEQMGLYVLTPPPFAPGQVEQFGLYVTSKTNPEAVVEQFGFYIVGRITPLVIPALANVTPETPIFETWAWLSDSIPSDDGGEQRISLRKEPRRSFANKFVFPTADDVREAQRQLFKAFREEVAISLHQYGTRLKAPAALAASYLTFMPERTDLRDDGWVLIVEDDKYEIKLVDTIDGTGCSITTPLDNAYTKRAKVIPVAVGLMEDKAALVRYNPNDVASLTIKSRENLPVVPFLRPGMDVELTEFGGLPVLERRAIGTEFDDIFDLGRQEFDYGGRIGFYIPWTNAKLSGEREYLTQRVFNQDDFDYMKTFFDYCKGTVNPFYLPTYRADFEVIEPPVASGSTFKVSGHAYSEDYSSNPAFKQIAIFSEAGVHYASISGVVEDGADDVLTFTPVLPADTAWEDDQAICLLLRARLGSDEVSLEHQALHTIFRTSVRTVDV